MRSTATLLLLLTGCRTPLPPDVVEGSWATDDPTVDDELSTLDLDVDPVPVCDVYPVPLDVDPDAEARARAALAAVDPDAQLAWDDARGAPSWVDVRFELACTGSVQEALLEVLGAHPDIFAMDPDEWGQAEMPVSCGSIGATTRRIRMGRVFFADHLSRVAGYADFSVRREGGKTTLVGVSGDYTPAASALLDNRLTACEALALDEGGMLQSFMGVQFGFLIGGWGGDAVGWYTPAATDHVLFPDWSWYDEGVWMRMGDGPELTFMREAMLIVDETHHTDELIGSNADCWDDIGWKVELDAVTGAVYQYYPGASCIF